MAYGDEAGYKGQILRAYDGRYRVLKSTTSEPDGSGGFLLDLTVKAENSDKVCMWPNMHTSVIECMMT